MSNKKEVCGYLEEARQGFADALMNALSNDDKIGQMSFEAQHKYFDGLVVKFGGDSVRKDDE
jgi:hypothetical protein